MRDGDPTYHPGIGFAVDCGSVAIKAAALDPDGNVVLRIHRRLNGRLQQSLVDVLREIEAALPPESCHLEALIGSGAASWIELLHPGAPTEIASVVRGALRLVPQAGAILEIGGEHAKFIRLNPGAGGTADAISDLFLNTECMAGIGIFLDREARRHRIPIETLGDLALRSTRSLRVAGRCAVFAKTDLTHQAQNGASLEDLSMALCRMTAANVAGGLIGDKRYRLPLVLIGGVAGFAGVRKALAEIMRLGAQSLIVPEDFRYIGVLGALAITRESGRTRRIPLREVIARVSDHHPVSRAGGHSLPRLTAGGHDGDPGWVPKPGLSGRDLEGGLLGIDIGSTTTNFACLDRLRQVLDVFSVPTSGQAATAVAAGLERLRETYGMFRPSCVGVTGSGRNFIGRIIGADCIVNEINAHAAGGAYFYPPVDTIFDIGGQDSKFIRMERGVVVDFRMNKVCAAGTGSFLEEISEQLGIDLKTEFAARAFGADNPTLMEERCSVFMASEALKKLQEGCPRADLVASLSYAVAKNYLSRVANRSKIGNFISFQGGVAGNRAVVRVLETLLGKPVHVHPLHEVAGAVGVALIAGKKAPQVSGFLGLDNADLRSLRSRSFVCRKCANDCEIHATIHRGGGKFFAGAMCELFEKKNPSNRGHTADPADTLFAMRDRELHRHVAEPAPGRYNGDVIGIPRALLYHEMLPFWSTFFNELGIPYALSDDTTRATIENGAALCPSSPCMPLKIAYGHCGALIGKGITKIFAPSIANLAFRTTRERLSHVCPSVQAWPFIARTLFPSHVAFLTPRLRFSFPGLLAEDMVKFGETLGRRAQPVLRALDRALSAQRDFYDTMVSAGDRVFSEKGNGQPRVVILGRPYLLGDGQFQVRLNKLLLSLGVSGIPWDVFDEPRMSCAQLNGMYWYFGKRFIQLARVLRERPATPVIFFSTFGCGSDSFLVHFLRQEFSGMPFLELEIDEHNDWTGVQTRLEAFFESLHDRPGATAGAPVAVAKCSIDDLRGRTLLIPRMSDHAFAFSAAFRSAGIDAHVLPLPDGSSIDAGKEAVAGQECFPCVAVTGDMLRYLRDAHSCGGKAAFFMISGDGPCRLGQYPYLQRLILDQRGFGDVPIFDASQDTEFYSRLEAVAPDFKRKVWQGTIACDLLYRKWRETRPYAPGRSGIDRIYDEELHRLAACIEANERLAGRLKESFRRLERECGPAVRDRPVIAVLGENYMRCNATANGRIEEALEALGAEVWVPSLYEWVYYTNWTARLHCRHEKRYREFAKLFLVDLWQHLYEKQLTMSVRGRLRSPMSPPVRRLFRMTSRYVPRTLEGETVLSIGRTLDYHARGVAGIIHVVPFGCMVGSIVDAMCERVSEDLGGFPLLTLHTDNRGEHLRNPALESFWLRATSWHERKPR